jgi:hypothetical protein
MRYINPWRSTCPRQRAGQSRRLNQGADAEILAMPADFQASLTRIADRIRASGLERVRDPHIKHLCGKLWETR